MIDVFNDIAVEISSDESIKVLGEDPYIRQHLAQYKATQAYVP